MWWKRGWETHVPNNSSFSRNGLCKTNLVQRSEKPEMENFDVAFCFKSRLAEITSWKFHFCLITLNYYWLTQRLTRKQSRLHWFLYNWRWQSLIIFLENFVKSMYRIIKFDWCQRHSPTKYILQLIGHHYDIRSNHKINWNWRCFRPNNNFLEFKFVINFNAYEC